MRFSFVLLFVLFLLTGLVSSGNTLPEGKAASVATSLTDLQEVILSLKNHIEGTSVLTVNEINELTTRIQNSIDLIGSDKTTISSAFELVNLFETKKGALFISSATKNGLSSTNHTGVELDWALFQVQQGILDYACTLQNIIAFPDVFQGAKFVTSTYFPGAVSPPSDPNAVYEVKIDGNNLPDWGSPVLNSKITARRPTGAYVAPGSIVTVKVPESIVNKGYNIRVGAQSWDLKAKTTHKRLPRVSIVYPITNSSTQIVHPLGGGIYIEVPYEANAGIVTIQITNAVRSPFFSAKSFDQTTLANWQNIERKNPAPWADFESDKFMMQVPASWIYNFDDPVTLMQDWDKGMDAVSELFGLPMVRNKSVLYLQIDVMMRGTANFPGYPQSNYAYSPTAVENGNKNHFTLKGPQSSDWTVFHELGHAQSFTKFRGETEAVVNFLYVAMQNKKFGMDLDTAYGNSVSGWPQISLDQGAIMWMVTDNFRNGREMNHSNVPGDEFKYQHRGFGKYVEIVKLFGWKALENFWKSVNEDYMKGIIYDTNNDPTDSRILRMSKAAGADLRPLIHFWGIQPENPTTLKSSIVAAGLKPSQAIYDELIHYKTIVPKNNDEFRAHAKIVYPGGPGSSVNPLFLEGTYYTWLTDYDATYGSKAQAAIQAIIDLYFPDGRPVETGSGVTGFENVPFKKGIRFYPNPVEDEFVIESSEQIDDIKIVNIKGQEQCFKEKHTESKHTLNVQELEAGLYFVTIRCSSEFTTCKMIVN